MDKTSNKPNVSTAKPSEEPLWSVLNEKSPILNKCASLNNCDYYKPYDLREDFSESFLRNANNLDEDVTFEDNHDEEDKPLLEEQEEAFLMLKVAEKHYQVRNYDEALSCYNKAISLHSLSPILYAKRAQVFLKLNKPMNCINDCSSALAMEPDHCLARKFRGRAYMLMGAWDKAICDLVLVEGDEEVNEWMDKLLPMINKAHGTKNIDEVEVGNDSGPQSEAGDNAKEVSLEEAMRDPEIREALDKYPKIKKLFKRMVGMIKGGGEPLGDCDEGDVGLPFFTGSCYVHPNTQERETQLDEINLTDLLETDKWLNSLKKHANYQEITEDYAGLHESNIYFEDHEHPTTTGSLENLSDFSD